MSTIPTAPNFYSWFSLLLLRSYPLMSFISSATLFLSGYKPNPPNFYLFLGLLVLAGCRRFLGHAQLRGHSGRVLATDRPAGRIGDALDLETHRRGSRFPEVHEQQTKIKSQMMAVENRATSSTEGLGGANHSTTLRSISFTFHIRQNGDKLRVTKAKQWPRWSTLTEEGKYGVPLLRFNRVLLPAGANVSRRVKSRPVESRQGHVCISDWASPSPLFHAQSWSS